MIWKDNKKTLAFTVGVFLFFFYLPIEKLQAWPRFGNAIWESLYLVRWYAQEHVLLCLIPAFFIAGAIGVFVSKDSVMKYLGAKANKALAYGVASVSGTILAVCSCTVLPLFAGIYRMGAGLGPACSFLYSGPAINVLAIIMTARILGIELGIARAVGAIAFSVIIGLVMHFIFRKEELEKANSQESMPEPEVSRPLWKNAIFFALMVGVLVFSNWGKPEETTGAWHVIYSSKWIITSILAILLAGVLMLWMGVNRLRLLITTVATVVIALLFSDEPIIPFIVAVIGLSWTTSIDDGEPGEWLEETWGFAKQIMPLLLGGVLVAGLLLGRPSMEGLIPSSWIEDSVGGNSISANLFAAVAGALMYFATLTEVPILQGLIGAGMGKGPSLALLLAGPALSLPNMLVIRSVMGTKKTVVFVFLVVVMATISGLLFGNITS
jgi:uncharacterized membrane protein YraQ (UPF0718 family)